MSAQGRYHTAAEATWPAAATRRLGPVTLREGQGGGSRVSAATVEGSASAEDITAAEVAMRAMGQDCLFMIREGEAELDAILAARGYAVKDPVTIWTCPVTQLTDVPVPRVTAFCVWEPLAIQHEIWAAGGIGPSRFAVMQRAPQPKTALLGRHNDKPAGAAFAAIHDGIAMVHALEIQPHQRRAGMGGWLMRQAAFWAQEQGATEVAVLCTRANGAANALYAALGMREDGHYHYRILEGGEQPA